MQLHPACMVVEHAADLYGIRRHSQGNRMNIGM